MKEKILALFFILFLGSFLIITLIAVDYYTYPIIENNKELKRKKSILDAFDIPVTIENLEITYAQNISKTEENKKIFYLSPSRDIAFEFSGMGMWGPISGIIAFESDLKTIIGICIIHQEETPGLGGRVAEKEFLNPFRNKKMSPRIIAVRPGQKSQKENEVDAITGATVTTNAFIDIINNQSKENLNIWRNKQ